MRLAHLVGLALWRGGVLLVGGYIAYQVLRTVLAFTDAQLEVAVAVFLTGLLMVFLSLVVERVQDVQEERSEIR
jgi:membrane protein implicated in regulation of membrane protease activity